MQGNVDGVDSQRIFIASELTARGFLIELQALLGRGEHRFHEGPVRGLAVRAAAERSLLPVDAQALARDKSAGRVSVDVRRVLCVTVFPVVHGVTPFKLKAEAGSLVARCSTPLVLPPLKVTDFLAMP